MQNKTDNNEYVHSNTDDTDLPIFDLFADLPSDNQITIEDRALTRQDFEQFLKERKQQEPNKYNFELMRCAKKKYENNEFIDVIGLTRNERECAINDKIKKDLDNEKTDTFFKKILSAPYDHQGQSEDHTFGVIYGKIEGKPFMIKSHIFDKDVYLPEKCSINGKTVCFSLQHSQDTKSCGVMAYEILKHIETLDDIKEILKNARYNEKLQKNIVTQDFLMTTKKKNLKKIAQYCQFCVDEKYNIIKEEHKNNKTTLKEFDNPKVNRRRFAIIKNKAKTDKNFYNKITNKVNLDKNTLIENLHFNKQDINMN